MDIKGKYYHATVLAKKDEKNRGRYYVHIEQLSQHISEQEGIICKNRVHHYRYTNSKKGKYGSYYPLQEGSHVLVTFTENDFNTAEIIKIVADKEINDVPFSDLEDRDEVYVVLKTPTMNGAIVITENSKSIPPKSLYVFSNSSSNKMIFNPDGIHIFTSGSRYVTISGDNLISIGGDWKIQTGGSMHLKAGGDISITAGGNINIQAGGIVAIDASQVFENSGASSSASGTSGYSETSESSKEIKLQ
jgi:hypothetical protein